MLLTGSLAGAATQATAGGAAATEHLQVQMTVDDTRHLLVRTGIGASASHALSLQGLTRQAAIDDIVDGIVVKPELPMPDWVTRPLPQYHARPDMDDESRARFNNERHAEFDQLRQWWVLNMLETTSPQTERLVLFWHDLFATNYHDLDRQTLAMARQNQTFRELGFGRWDVLLKAMIRDAALLEFLDSGSNHKASPNENLARELMELFVLGEGNYTEADVREAARALTGHDTTRFHDLAFRLKTWAQDRKNKQLFGRSGAFDGDDLVDLLLQQPAAPRFLATRFWHAFVSDNPPPPLWVDDQANRFRQSGLDIAALYRNVLESEAFWHVEQRGSMIKSPVDLVTGTARTLEYPKRHWQKMPQWQSLIGMNLFAPPNVAGWQEGAAFVTPGHLLNRYRVVWQLTRNVPAERLQTAGAMREPGMEGQRMVSQLADMQSMHMQPDNSGSMSMTSPLQTRTQQARITLAADDFHGPAEFMLSLVDGTKTLWQSKAQPFLGGRDTVMPGRAGGEADLSWQTVNVAVPLTHLKQSTAVRVHFVNDAADASGDRNLYVDAVQLGDQQLLASHGVQHSGCSPDLQANAGNLYCSGYVQLALDAQSIASTSAQDTDKPDPGITASAVHVQWGAANSKNGKRTLAIVLDDVKMPEKSFQHVGFTIEKKRNEPLMLLIDSFSCWPDCIEYWPECAWQDEHFTSAEHVGLPWSEAYDERWSQAFDHQCQFESLSVSEKQLVSTLWVELPDLLSQASQTPRVRQKAEQWMPVIDYLKNEYLRAPLTIETKPYAAYSMSLSIGSEHAPPAPVRRSLTSPALKVPDLSTLLKVFETSGMQVHQLLLPALAEHASEGVTTQLAAGNRGKEISVRRPDKYLRTMLENPLFQLK